MKSAFLLTLMITLCTYHSSLAGKYAETVRGFYMAIDAGDFAKAGTYLSSDLQAMLPFSPVPFDLNGYRAIGMSMREGFPDMQHRILEITEGKGSCAFKALFVGTNSAPLQGNPPTGNHVELPFLGYFKFNKSGKVTHVDIQFDLTAFNAQLLKGIPKAPNTATVLTNRFFNEVGGGKHNVNALNEILAPDFKSAFPMPNANRDQFISGIKGLLAGYPDITVTITSQFFEGNKVFTYGYWQGTNTGSFMGMPPTGKKVKVEFMDIWTERDGKLVDNNVVMDIAGLQAQLGDPNAAIIERNTNTVKNIYTAFGKGDVPTIMSNLADNVVWTDAGTAVGKLHYTTRKGKSEVMNFFAELNKSIEVTDFKVHDYTATGNKVVANGFYRGKTRTSGRQVATDFAMIWEFNDAGKVVKHHIYLDTDNVSKALSGVNNNLATAQLAYRDFVNGNIDGILSVLSNNIYWYHAGDPKKLPFAGSYKGKEQVMKFFGNVASNIETQVFEPFDFNQAGNVVTNKIRIKGKVISTGAISENVVDVKWTFDQKGIVTRWEATGDMHTIESAFAK